MKLTQPLDSEDSIECEISGHALYYHNTRLRQDPEYYRMMQLGQIIGYYVPEEVEADSYHPYSLKVVHIVYAIVGGRLVKYVVTPDIPK